MATDYKSSGKRASAAKPDNGGGNDKAKEFEDLPEKARKAIEEHRKLHEALRGPEEKDFGKAPSKPRDGWKLPPAPKIVELPY